MIVEAISIEGVMLVVAIVLILVGAAALWSPWALVIGGFLLAVLSVGMVLVE